MYRGYEKLFNLTCICIFVKLGNVGKLYKKSNSGMKHHIFISVFGSPKPNFTNWRYVHTCTYMQIGPNMYIVIHFPNDVFRLYLIM
jgi:hypothetical protein